MKPSIGRTFPPAPGCARRHGVVPVSPWRAGEHPVPLSVAATGRQTPSPPYGILPPPRYDPGAAQRRCHTSGPPNAQFTCPRSPPGRRPRDHGYGSGSSPFPVDLADLIIATQPRQRSGAADPGWALAAALGTMLLALPAGRRGSGAGGEELGCPPCGEGPWKGSAEGPRRQQRTGWAKKSS